MSIPSIPTSRQSEIIIHRVGSILQQLFWIFRENLFDKHLQDYRVAGPNIFLYHCPPTPASRDFDLVCAFNRPAFPVEKWRLVALAHHACADSVAWMYDLLVHMLAGHFLRIEEVVAMIKPQLNVVDVYNSTGLEIRSRVSHLFWKITMLDGTAYAFDLSGEQFGYFDTVIPWAEYLSDRVEEVRGIEDPSGWRSHRIWALRQRDWWGSRFSRDDQRIAARARVHSEHSEMMLGDLRRFEWDSWWNVRQSLLWPEGRFQLYKEALLEQVGEMVYVRADMRSRYRQGWWRPDLKEFA